MTPEEIVRQIRQMNRHLLKACPADQACGTERILALMDAAALRGFQFGSNVAMSMVQGSLLVQLARADGECRKDPV